VTGKPHQHPDGPAPTSTLALSGASVKGVVWFSRPSPEVVPPGEHTDPPNDTRWRVMVSEVLAVLRPSPGEWFVDATIGLGGHSEALLERLQPGGRLLGLDCDVEALEHTRRRLRRFGDAVALVHGSFRDLATHVAAWGRQADGALFDLGVSSHQLASAARGFSFSLEGPLDMRMDTSGGMTAGRSATRDGSRGPSSRTAGA